MLLNFKVLAWLSLFAAIPAFASTEPVNVNAVSVRSHTTTTSRTAQSSQLSLGLSNEVFLQPDFDRGENQTEQVLGVSYYGHSENNYLQGAIDARGAVGLRNPKSYWYFYMPEAYVSSKDQRVSSQSQVSLGRKLEDWSALDDEWNLGIWQPRFRWNNLNAEEQGLTGAFYKYRPNSNFEVMAFGSMLYVPEQGAGYTIAEGQFISGGSQYFAYPQKSGNLLGKDTPFQYQIERPSVASIVFQPTLAVKTTVGNQSSGPMATLGYANKPTNALAVEATPRLLTSGVADIELRPLVYRHELLTAEFRQHWRRNVAWASVTREFVSMSTPNLERITQRYGDATISGVGIEQNMTDYVPEVPTIVGLSYLNRAGGDAVDVGELSNPNDPLFASRYPFKSAALFKMRNQFTSRVSLQSKFWFDFENESRAVSMYAEYLWTRNTRIGLGGEILAAPQTAPRTGLDADLISRFRANDRVFAGLSYDF